MNEGSEVDRTLYERSKPNLHQSVLLNPYKCQKYDTIVNPIMLSYKNYLGNTIFLSSMIRSSDWRETISAITPLLISGDKRFLDDIIYRFDNGSKVLPHLTIVLMFLHKQKSIEYVTNLLENIENVDSKSTLKSKKIACSWIALSIIDENFLRSFNTEREDTFKKLQIYIES